TDDQLIGVSAECWVLSAESGGHVYSLALANALICAERLGAVPVPLNEAGHTDKGFLDLLVGGGVAHAHVTFAVVAEGGAWDDGDFLFLEQAERELLRGHAGDGDRREGVEGAQRLRAGEADLIQALDQAPAAAVVFG